jgi:hypothetical protein
VAYLKGVLRNLTHAICLGGTILLVLLFLQALGLNPVNLTSPFSAGLVFVLAFWWDLNYSA